MVGIRRCLRVLTALGVFVCIPLAAEVLSARASALAATQTVNPALAQHFEGAGDDVVSVAPIPSTKRAVAHIVGSGSGNFIVESYDAVGKQLDLMVNTIGAYDGTRPLNFGLLLSFGKPTEVGTLAVKANGPWTIDIQPLKATPKLKSPGRHDGNGDTVLRVGGSPRVAAFDASQASANFIVQVPDGGFDSLPVNEIAPYTGKVVWPGSGKVMTVQATGPWSVELT